MSHRRWLTALVAACVVLGACSQRATNETTGTTAAPPTTRPVEPSRDVLYVQHALLGTTTSDQNGTTLTLTGVDQVMTWTTDDESGVLPTADFIASWADLGLDGDNPQAAFVPADVAQSPVVVELSNPAWDGERRTITYRVRPVTEPEERLRGMVRDPNATLPEQFDVATLVISQPDAPALPEAPTTTTTTTVPPPPPETAPLDPSTATSAPSTSSRATTANPTVIVPPPEPPPPEDPPVGPSQFTFSPVSLEFPVNGGTRTIQLTNVGAGVGSWSMSPDIGTGLSVSPVGGYLFPGSSVTVTIQYNGRGPARDFAASIELLTSSGRYLIPVVVG